MPAVTVDDPAGLLAGRYGIIPDRLPAGDAAVADALATLIGRRTCRAYTDAPVAAADLPLLLAAAQSAPTKSNLQQYSIVRVSDPGLRQRIGGLAPTMPWITMAAEFWVFCGDVRRLRRQAGRRGHAYRNDNADTFMNACVDAAAAMMACIVAAEALGYGTCPISAVRNRIDACCALLAVPPGVFPIAGLCIGQPAPAAADRPVQMRLPPEAVLHENRFDESGIDAAIDAYDDRAHHRHPLAPGAQRHTDLYGPLDRCTWSENASRQVSQPEREGFALFLARHGIHLAG